ncbi:hypothetical protein LSAT2_032780, partial [Lamellibrachia satsuma]
ALRHGGLVKFWRFLDMQPIGHKTFAKHTRSICEMNKIVDLCWICRSCHCIVSAVLMQILDMVAWTPRTSSTGFGQMSRSASNFRYMQMLSNGGSKTFNHLTRVWRLGSAKGDENPQYGRCPVGAVSWCFYQKALATGHHTNVGAPLSADVAAHVKEVYARLTHKV